MRSPLLHKVTKALVGRGLAVLRFNFRGVGASSGEWSGGVGEIDDVGAAIDAARADYPAVALAGWSFGAATALRWQERERDTSVYVGIAPPVSGTVLDAPPSVLPPARRLFIVGDRDQFVTVDEMAEYSSSIGASLEVVAGSDHFFHFREEVLGELIADFVQAG